MTSYNTCSQEWGADFGFFADMGPDAATTYKDQIDGPIQRVGTSKSKTNNYIIIHCNDPKGYCSRKVNGRTVGGT